MLSGGTEKLPLILAQDAQAECFFVPGPNSESYGKTWGCSGELTPLFEHLLGGGISDRLCLVAPGYNGTLALLQHLPVWDQ